MLHVGLFLAVARPSERQPRQQACRAHGDELFLVEEIIIAALMAEEQPVAAGRVDRLPLLQERAKRRHAGAGADHDDRLGWIVRQREMLGLLHIDPDLVAGSDAPAEEGRADAEPRALLDLITYRIDGERDAAGIAAM